MATACPNPEEMLPPETWVHVLSFVDAESVARSVCLVSRAFHALATEPQLWRQLMLRHFPAVARTNLYGADEADGGRKTFFAHRWLHRSKRPRFCVLGHVDCGKSTLLGRILAGLGKISTQEIERLRQESERLGPTSFTYAWALDRSLPERERGITIHGRARECTLANGREIEVVDLPGHRDYLKNLIIGTAMADVAILVVAACLGEFEAGMAGRSYYGSIGGTREHLRLAKRLNVSKVIVTVTKMDDYSVRGAEDRFIVVKDEVLKLAAHIGFQPEDLVVIPIAAWSGENVVKAPALFSWYKGPTLPELMEQTADAITSGSCGEELAKRPIFGPVRVSVMRRVLRAEKAPDEVVVVALVQAGTVREGRVLHGVLPGPKRAHRARRRAGAAGGGGDTSGATAATSDVSASFTVASIERFGQPVRQAAAGELVGLRLQLKSPLPGPVPATANMASAQKEKAAMKRLVRGVVLSAAEATATGDKSQTASVKAFTVRLVHTVDLTLRQGFTPSCIIHLASVPCRVEKVIKCWDKEGNEVEVQEETKMREGMSSLVEVKPLGYVFVEPYTRNAALGTVVVTNSCVVATGSIESVLFT